MCFFCVCGDRGRGGGEPFLSTRSQQLCFSARLPARPGRPASMPRAAAVRRKGKMSHPGPLLNGPRGREVAGQSGDMACSANGKAFFTPVAFLSLFSPPAFVFLPPTAILACARPAVPLPPTLARCFFRPMPAAVSIGFFSSLPWLTHTLFTKTKRKHIRAASSSREKNINDHRLLAAAAALPFPPPPPAPFDDDPLPTGGSGPSASDHA